MNKYLLLLLIPLFALSCSDDDRTDEEIRNDNINRVVKNQEGMSDAHNFRNYMVLNIEFEDTELYKNQKKGLDLHQNWLNENQDTAEKELIEKVKKAIKHTQSIIDRSRAFYTIPSYTVIFDRNAQGNQWVEQAFVSQDYNYLGKIVNVKE